MADQTEIDGNFEIFDEDYFEQLTTYEDKKKYFEIFHFKTITPKPKYQNLCWVNQDYGRLELHEWDSGDIGSAYCNRTVIIMEEDIKINKKGEEVKKTKPKEILFTKKWLKDENIRTYNRIDFIPYNKISSKLTYWNGNKEVAYNSFLGYSMNCLSKLY